ncbi:MAG: PQQ-dependent sugar dehydrogenase [Bryobacterales bacterium]|nr:PQQ-dependent sugar dehydrogenase [Bryobacterales bacterium]
MSIRYASLAVALLPSFAFFGLMMAQDGPDSVRRPVKRFSRKVLVSGLAHPWELTWGPDNRLWVTERTGKRITRVDPTNGEKRVAITIPEVVAPGSQDGLPGMALHPGLLKGTGEDFVYAVYTYVDERRGPHAWIPDPKNPYRSFYAKVVRLTYDRSTETLGKPVDLITGLPAGNDHNALRIKFGPDKKLYLSFGDQGNNQFGNFCRPIESQRLPTKQEMARRDYSSYVGKIIRMNPDGSIPRDNPKLAGVVSHVYSYGHRNPQGLDFGPDGTLYSTEHGPKTDDEVNVIRRGGNYGWPNLAGLQDGKAYEYARWSDSTTPCTQLRYDDLDIPASVPREPESAFKQRHVEPIATMFTVEDDYNFSDPACKGVDVICWPTTGVSGVEHYQAGPAGIPGWDRVLLIPTLKRGSLYVLPLKADGKAAAGPMWRYFQSENRYRDTAVSPDRRTIYIATDPDGMVEGRGGGMASAMESPGAILAFTYEGEGEPDPIAAPQPVSGTRPPAGVPAAKMLNGKPPRFSAAQVAAGREAYTARCAVCHGSTMTNGAYGTPLAGDYFKNKWHGQSVRSLFDKSKTMPPADPASLPDATYASLVAYMLEMNGFKAGDAELPAGGEALDSMAIR